MSSTRRTLNRLALAAGIAVMAAGASADELDTSDPDFQKGLALGAALTYQSATLGFGEDELDAESQAVVPQAYVIESDPEADAAKPANLSDMLGFSDGTFRMPTAKPGARRYTLADAVKERLWRKKVAAKLRQRMQ